ncbi:MAG: acyl-CoA dehydrogenase family protein [Acidobacteriia bacterium]|nr:acyl-CoA dehydrogenase family protein [Terriglobia bacterium]
MNFDPNPADGPFREELRASIQSILDNVFPGRPPAGGRLWASGRENMRRWMRALNEKGLAVPYWPEEWGGRGWPPAWRSIFEDEVGRADCPQRDMISIGFVGPVLYTFGTDEQKKKFLPRIRNGDDAWCQGFSESDAGSDLLALRATAIRQGEHFVVNGRKLWITRAHDADMMFALVRVEAPGNRRQQGLSFLLLDMRSPGVTVVPIRMIDGIPHVNEVVLENVRVPVENLVGEQGKGWVYARFLLDQERSLVAQLPGLRRLTATLRKALSNENERGAPLIGSPSWRLKLAQFEAELGALEFLELRFLNARSDDPTTQVLASILKLRGTDLRQRVSEALWDVFGDRSMEFSLYSGTSTAMESMPEPVHWSAVNHLFQRSATIAGGTSEIQRNIIAGVSLGL